MTGALVVLRCASIAALVLGVVQIGLTTRAHSDDKEVRYLSYSNCGAYTVGVLSLVWEYDGKRHSKKLAANIKGNSKVFKTSNNLRCFDLTKQDIPVGSEVWLKYQIDGGNTENCRKSNPRIYSDISQSGQWYKSAGDWAGRTPKGRFRSARYRNARYFRFWQITCLRSRSGMESAFRCT